MDKISDQIAAIAKERDEIMLSSKEHEQLLSIKPDLLAKTADQILCAVYQFSANLDKIIYVNPTLEKWWGESRDSLYKNPEAWFDRIHPDDRTMVKNALTQLSPSNSTGILLEYRLQKADGSISYMQNRYMHVNDYVIGTVIDISKYVRAQQRHFIYEQVLNAYHLESSDEIILNAILKVVCQSLDWDEGEIWVYNQLDESLYCVSLWHRLGNAITPFYDITYHMVVKAGVGFSDIVMRNNSPLLENNFGDNTSYYRSKAAKVVGLNTALGTPIVFQNEIIGVLNLFNRKTKNLSSDGMLVIQKIAELIGTITQKIIKLDKPESSIHQDNLTGLTNRAGFELLLNACIENLSSDEKLAVVIVDLDKFKSIIETYGSEIGDILLKQISFKFIQTLGHDAKTIAHLETDVYAFIFDNLERIQMLRPSLDNISASLQKPFIIKEQNIHVKASIGVSIFPDDGSDCTALITNADIALKKVKTEGGNAIRLYNETFEKKLMDDINTESALRHALSANQFKLLYQPRVDLKTGKIISVEALLRWQDPTNGLKLPHSFMQVAEESGLAIFIDEWALLNISHYFSLIHSNLPVAISLSECQFKKSQNVLNLMNHLIDKFSIKPALLQIEITEKILMTHTKDILDILSQLKGKGISIIMNHFGSEFSSFNYLQQLQPSHVKIDKSFVAKIPNDTKTATIIQTMIQFCHTLGIKVIAEDVETAEQVKFLLNEACDEIQGSYFSKPLSIYEMKAFLEKGTTLMIPD